MQRYHKKVFFPEQDKQALKELTDKLNSIEKYGYSDHCLENLKYRAIDMMAVLKRIRDTWLEYGQIFEYYKLNDSIEKVCYRIAYDNATDLILVLSNKKLIVTIYINSADDDHETLKEELYQRG